MPDIVGFIKTGLDFTCVVLLANVFNQDKNQNKPESSQNADINSLDMFTLTCWGDNTHGQLNAPV